MAVRRPVQHCGDALEHVSAATGIGSMPGEDFVSSVRLVVERAAGPATPSRAPCARSDRGPDGPRRRGRRRSRLRPAAGRLAAHRRAGDRPPACALAAGAGPRRARGAARRLRGPVQGPGRRAVDAGRDDREAPRRQGALRLRRAPRARPGAGRGRPRAPRGRAATRSAAPSWCCRSTSRPCRSCSAVRCRPRRGSTGTAR